jgi:hypothetical protein
MNLEVKSPCSRSVHPAVLAFIADGVRSIDLAQADVVEKTLSPAASASDMPAMPRDPE